MKKILYFFAFVLTAGIMLTSFNSGNNASVRAAEAVELTNNNFVSELTDLEQDFILTENIILSNWNPINFSGNLNGNGFTITLDKNLFITLNNATITNLGIIIENTYIFDNKDYSFSSSDFGILAQTANYSTINQVYASGNIKAEIKASANIGGLIGNSMSSNITNSYVKTNIEVTQYSSEALLTVVGGFIGSTTNSTITNCFAVPNNINIITATIDNSLVEPQTQLLLGGFIGIAERGSALGIISNIFCGGVITYNYPHINAVVSSGKIFGEVKDFSDNKLSYCYTFNNQAEGTFIGKPNDYININIDYKESAIFGDTKNFLQSATSGDELIWNFLYVWNVETIWTKNESFQFIVLQVFENFSIMLNSSLNDVGIKCGIFLFENEIFTPTDLTSFKFGDKLLIEVEIIDEFVNYKQIKALIKTDTNSEINLVFVDNFLARYEFTANAKSVGAYYATTENINYTLRVITEDSNRGLVMQGSSTIKQSSFTRTIVYGGGGEGYTFVADPASNSFAFANWSWLDKDNEQIVAMRGALGNSMQAKKSITIAFGQTGTNTDITYLNHDENSEIPYITEEDGSITYTIQANFTENVCNLNVQTPIDKDACKLYVDGVWVNESNVDFIDIFNQSVQVGKSIEIRIEMKDEFKFKQWKVEGVRPLSNFIKATETETSTTINLTITENFVLILEIEEDKPEGADLTWLWIVLGAVGGIGLISFISIMIIRSSRKKEFLNQF
ncbi:MAG: hypothetical protein PHI76_00515 [Clostridia bacterium]|nr:hypothetical protein [Clostridia bacterium]